jgi:hypothetical protein
LPFQFNLSRYTKGAKGGAAAAAPSSTKRTPVKKTPPAKKAPPPKSAAAGAAAAAAATTNKRKPKGWKADTDSEGVCESEVGGCTRLIQLTHSLKVCVCVR